MMHLSRLAEELVLWSSADFAFIELSDGFCTGSSIMPQKKNPDVPELVRGKTGRVYGNLVSLLTLMKALPLAYNKDMQEDKEPMFDSIDTVRGSLKVFTEMIAQLSVNGARMRDAAGRGFSTATDIADYLVRKGLPFRQAHEVVGKTVRHCLETGKTIPDLTLEEFRQFSKKIEADIFAAVTLEASVNARQATGGTARSAVAGEIARARAALPS
jgi:argininosuccinate lyase